jgi:hypothetical protein
MAFTTRQKKQLLEGWGRALVLVMLFLLLFLMMCQPSWNFSALLKMG